MMLIKKFMFHYQLHGDCYSGQLPIPLQDVTEEEVIIAVSQLKNGKSAGIDQIQAELLKNALAILINLLMLIWIYIIVITCSETTVFLIKTTVLNNNKNCVFLLSFIIDFWTPRNVALVISPPPSQK